MNTKTLTAMCLVSLLTTGLAEGVSADQSNQTSREGLPGRRVDGGTRRGNCVLGTKRLTALIPESNLGLTVAGYPTFFFYMPQTATPKPVEFVLQDENDNQLYQTTFTTTGDSGIINLQLPDSATLPPLKTGKKYHWYFSVLCNPQNRADDVVVEGWTQKVALNPVLARKLEKASLEERAALYISENHWHEALVTLAELRRDRPDDSAIAEQWAKLLQSVGLDAIAQEPLFKNQNSTQPVATR
ncbi:MAG TPA: DUF928 domain-containing protein [Candidatus Obscuribacterales bacterium]